jgi:hypothetical protein
MRRAPRARKALISDLHLETDIREIRRAADKCIENIDAPFLTRGLPSLMDTSSG